MRHRVLTDGELRHVWSELANIREEVALAVRCCTLLGGQRMRQLLRATWSDYDSKAGVLRLVDPKGKRSHALEHLLPVSNRVAMLLKRLKYFNGFGAFIFSTNSGKTPIHSTTLPSVFSNIRASWPRAKGEPPPDFPAGTFDAASRRGYKRW